MERVESTIERVTVYHQGATVRRVVELTARAGGALPEVIELVGLPLALVDPTVRVRVGAVHGEPGAALVAADVRVELFAPARAAPDATADERALRELLRELARTQQLDAQIRAEMAVLEGMPVPPRPEPEEGQPPPPAPLAARLALEQFRAAALDARRAELRALRDEMNALGEQVAAAQRRLEHASTASRVAPHELSKAVVARLRREGAGAIARAAVLVEYFVPGARWAPAYECRTTRDGRAGGQRPADGAEGPQSPAAELVLRALVVQRSGEDWRGVRLSLSTASPMSWTELPELSALRIGRAQPAPDRGAPRPAPSGAEALFADFDRDRANAAALLPPAAQFEAPDFSTLRPPALLAAEFGAGAAPPRPKPAPSSARKQKRAAPPPARAARARAEMAEELVEAAPAPEAAFESADLMEMDDEAVHERAIGKSMAPPAALAAPAPSPASKGGRRTEEARFGGGGGGGAAHTAAFEVVLYNHLRLPAPDDAAHRNRLRPVDLFASYRERLAARGLDAAGLDVTGVVRDAMGAAWQPVAQPLPPGAGDVRAMSGHFDYAYETEAAVDVPSDGVFHSVPVGRRSCPADVLYLAVPREEPLVYRQATITNPLAAPLLAGPVDVYVGGEFVISTTLPTVPARGEFRLGLGVEQAVRVARNAQFTERRSGTRAVATNELRHEITIELANNLEREVACEVRERIPQPSQGAEVDVEEARVEPAWEPYKQDERGAPIEGGRRWRVRVGAGKKATLRAEYVIKVYANNEIVGGNRREA